MPLQTCTNGSKIHILHNLQLLVITNTIKKLIVVKLVSNKQYVHCAAYAQLRKCFVNAGKMCSICTIRKMFGLRRKNVRGVGICSKLEGKS